MSADTHIFGEMANTMTIHASFDRLAKYPKSIK